MKKLFWVGLAIFLIIVLNVFLFHLQNIAIKFILALIGGACIGHICARGYFNG